MFLDKLTSIFTYSISPERKLSLARRETEKIKIAEEELERQRLLILHNRYRGGGLGREGTPQSWLSEEQEIDLSIARKNRLIWNRPGKGFYVTTFHADQDNTRIRFNSLASPYYRIHRGYIKADFNKIYLTNTAQVSGKILRFVVSSKDSVEFRLETGADIQNAYDELVLIRGLTESIKLNNIRAATAPTIQNVTLTNADEEYNMTIPENTKRFKVVLADLATFRLAYETGKVAAPTAPYWTQPANIPYEEKIGLYLNSKTVYIASPVSAKVAQMASWV